MTEEDFLTWCEQNGYITGNDWNYQVMYGKHYYFILNPKTDKFALIEYRAALTGTDWQAWYKVLVKNFNPFNDWAKRFHEETGGFWK